MSIHFNSVSFQNLTFLREKILRPLSDSEKKIALIATLALTCLVACIMAYRHLIKMKPVGEDAKQKVETKKTIITPKEESAQEKKEEPLKKAAEKSKEQKFEKKEDSLPKDTAKEKKEEPLKKAAEKSKEQKFEKKEDPLHKDTAKEEKEEPLKKAADKPKEQQFGKKEAPDPKDKVEEKKEVVEVSKTPVDLAEDPVLDEAGLAKEEAKKISLPERPTSPVVHEAKTEIFKMPPLLAFGEVRKGSGVGDPPRPDYTYTSPYLHQVISHLVASAFTACFHTTKSRQEIEEFIKSMWTKSGEDVRFDEENPGEYVSAFNRLYENLVYLEKALPGDHTEKKMKIYWDDQVEKNLFPLFADTSWETKDLSFRVVAGEEITSSFQAQEMDFNCQLQFIGKDSLLLQAASDEFDAISREVVGINRIIILKMY